MNLSFSKYHGAGNDFILIDDRKGSFPGKDHETIRRLCDRHTGVGADGLMLLQNSSDKIFHMAYYNSDGYEGTMCGNGGRCIVAFTRELGMVDGLSRVDFSAVDGDHEAFFIPDGRIALKMKNVNGIRKTGKGYAVDTGSLHHVEYVDKLVDMDVYRRGKAIRERSSYAPDGCNVNFIHDEKDGTISIRTYERGVENETLACGTGSIAAAIVHHHHGKLREAYTINALGGTLKVRFEFRGGERYENIWLEGPAAFVFKGVWAL